MSVRPARSWRPLVALLAVILGLGLSAVAAAWRHSSGGAHAATDSCPNASLTAEVDLRPLVRIDQPFKLQDSAEILTRRLATYGCGSKVSVDGERLHVSTSATGLDHLDALIAPGQLQFREVLEAGPRRSGCLVAVDAAVDSHIPACSKDGSEEFRLGPAKVVGADIEGATAQRDQSLGEWQVLVRFTKEGQRRWTALTEQTVGKRVAMVLDGVVISAPNIQERIDGDAQISGSFTEDSATALASTLEHGALPIQLTRA